MNGVAIYATTNLTKRDGCFGHRIDGAYVYVEAFPCLFGDDRNHYHTVRRRPTLALALLSDRTGPPPRIPQHFRSGVIGVMNDGFPLFGPLDEHGHIHEGLDECGGRYNEDGAYAYYASLAPPCDRVLRSRLRGDSARTDEGRRAPRQRRRRTGLPRWFNRNVERLHFMSSRALRQG